MKTTKQPISVIILSFFILMGGGIGGIFGSLNIEISENQIINNTMKEIIVHFIKGTTLENPILLFYGIGCVVLAVALMNGKNWARLLFLWLYPLKTIVVWLRSGVT